MGPFFPIQDSSFFGLKLPIGLVKTFSKMLCQLSMYCLSTPNSPLSACSKTMSPTQRCPLYSEMLNFASRGCWRGQTKKKGVFLVLGGGVCVCVFLYNLLFAPRPALSLSTHLLAAAAKLLQSCPTLCDPIDGSPPGSPVPGILQARTLEWVAISFSNA